jgi:hypothetical protein
VLVISVFMRAQDALKCALIDLKTGKGGSPSWVQIPPPPPNTPDSMMMLSGFFLRIGKIAQFGRLSNSAH